MDEIRFIDLFSGIGGFRRGLELSGGYRCIWSCDNNKYANQVYTSRFGGENHHSGDIRKVKASSIPDHDLLCAGFPCQAFSVAGKRHGFRDTRGTLFFEIARIARAKRPTLLLLENVKGLLSHDEGFTYQIILESLEELGYLVEWQVLNSKHYGVPQNRERVFIVGHLRGRSTRPIFPITEPSGSTDLGNAGEQVASALQSPGHGMVENYRGMNMILDPFNKAERQDMMAGAVKTNQGSPTSTKTAIVEPFIKNIPHGYNDGFEKELPSLKANKGSQYNELLVQPVLTPDRLQKCQHGRRFKEDGEHRFTLTGQDQHGIMVANCVTDGWLMDTSHHDKPICEYRIRRLTPVECERLQGFPDGWTEFGYEKGAVLDWEPVYGYYDYINEDGQLEHRWGEVKKTLIDPISDTVRISDTQRYKCLGNAVTVNVIKFLGDKIKESIISKSRRMQE